MCFQPLRLEKGPWAVAAGEAGQRRGIGVNSGDVSDNAGTMRERGGAVGAAELGSRVGALVLGSVGAIIEGLIAVAACVWLVSGVDPLVLAKGGAATKGLVAVAAGVWLLS